MRARELRVGRIARHVEDEDAAVVEAADPEVAAVVGGPAVVRLVAAADRDARDDLAVALAWPGSRRRSPACPSRRRGRRCRASRRRRNPPARRGAGDTGSGRSRRRARRARSRTQSTSRSERRRANERRVGMRDLHASACILSPRAAAERRKRCPGRRDILPACPSSPTSPLYVEALSEACGGSHTRIRPGPGPGAAAQRRPAARGGRGPARRRACGAWASGWCSALEGELFLILHLMIAGRLRWSDAGARRRTRPRRWPASSSRPEPSRSPRRGPASAPRCTSCRARRRSRSTTRAGSRCWRRARRSSARGSPPRATRSSARSPIRGSSRGSATPTPTRSCTGPGSRR